MGLFGGKKAKVVDFSENYNAARKFAQRQQSSSNASSTSDNLDMGFLSTVGSSATTDNFAWDNEPSQPASSSETVGDYSEKKQKLAKRLLDMTDKIEDLSNQIYHLTQRIELLEKKNKVSYNN